jgi:peptide/nickel transport system substrate-binding protein
MDMQLFVRIASSVLAFVFVVYSSLVADEQKISTDASGLNTLIDLSFKVPTLAELDKSNKWIDKPVVDGMKRYEEYLAKQPEPIPLAEALKLKNDSLVNNAKILAALGRQPTAKTPADYNATIQRRLKGDVSSTNPILANTVEEFDIQSLLGVSFFGFDWTMEPFAVSEYVVSWQTSEDGLKEKVVLRKDMTWSDGKPITAHDAVFSFQVIMNPDVPVLAQRTSLQDVAWVEAYDDQTLVIFHKKALSTNVWSINYPIIPKHVYSASLKQDTKLKESEYHRGLEKNPITGGPYIIKDRREQQYMLLERREDWYQKDGKQLRPKPFFKEIRFNIITDPNTARLALLNGDIEELELNMQQWQKQTSGDDFYEKNTKVRDVEWTFFYFGWNNRSHFFEDKRVRQAMSYAFDHTELLRVQNFGLTEPAMGPFHPASWMFPKAAGLKPYQQDLEKADELLADAGWEDTDNNGVLDKLCKVREKQPDGSVKLVEKRVQFDFVLICVSDPTRIEACNLMKSCLEKLSIKVTVRPMELVSLIEKTNKHEFDGYFGGWGTGTDPDTSENIWTTNAIDNGRNYICYSNKYVDGLYELGKQTEQNLKAREEIVAKYDLTKVGIQATAKRPEIYGKINQLIYNDQAGTFAYYRSAFFAFNKKLQGVSMSPRGPYHFSPGFGGIWKQVP